MEEAEKEKDLADVKFQEWIQNTTNVKQCPNCSTIIDSIPRTHRYYNRLENCLTQCATEIEILCNLYNKNDHIFPICTETSRDNEGINATIWI
jgi:adenylate kinase family enzyme